jgi:hypothetical protein
MGVLPVIVEIDDFGLVPDALEEVLENWDVEARGGMRRCVGAFLVPSVVWADFRLFCVALESSTPSPSDKTRLDQLFLRSAARRSTSSPTASTSSSSRTTRTTRSTLVSTATRRPDLTSRMTCRSLKPTATPHSSRRSASRTLSSTTRGFVQLACSLFLVRADSI